MSYKGNQRIHILDLPNLEQVPPATGFLHLHPCRPATSWGRPGLLHGEYLLSGKPGPAPDTAQKGHPRGRSQSKLVRASAEQGAEAF